MKAPSPVRGRTYFSRESSPSDFIPKFPLVPRQKCTQSTLLIIVLLIFGYCPLVAFLNSNTDKSSNEA